MKSFFGGLTGRVVVFGDSGYFEARQEFNRAVQQYPVAIDYCRDKLDVANAVAWSKEHRVPLRVRGGGRSFEGYSSGSGTLVIDVSKMDGIGLEEDTGTLYVQGGATNGQVCGYAASRGYPFPGGTCPAVGVAGYVLGGGWGPSCRMFGLGCDSLEGLELIDCEGKLIRADRARNADLFWACRGAGAGNFGVVTAMKFRLPPKTDQVTLIKINYPRASPREREAFLRSWQEWLRGADPRITLLARICNSSEGPAMLVRGIFYGGEEEVKRMVEPFLALPGAEERFRETALPQAAALAGNDAPPPAKFQSVSRFAMRDFSRPELAALAGMLRERPEGSVRTELSLYALGGRVRDFGPDETAFFYRDARFAVRLETVWKEERFAEENQGWLKDRFPSIAFATEGSYVNFPYKGFPDALTEYYGAHGCRLKRIKEKYDPLCLFTFPQGLSAGATPQKTALVPAGPYFLRKPLDP